MKLRELVSFCCCDKAPWTRKTKSFELTVEEEQHGSRSGSWEDELGLTQVFTFSKPASHDILLHQVLSLQTLPFLFRLPWSWREKCVWSRFFYVCVHVCMYMHICVWRLETAINCLQFLFHLSFWYRICHSVTEPHQFSQTGWPLSFGIYLPAPLSCHT